VEYIDRKVHHLAESLVVKGEFLSWGKFTLHPLALREIKIALMICTLQLSALARINKNFCTEA
jgi:hypothetical protein